MFALDNTFEFIIIISLQDSTQRQERENFTRHVVLDVLKRSLHERNVQSKFHARSDFR